MSTYISSTIGFRSKGSLCYSLNNHYSLNNRVCNNSLCCSCSCCAFPCHGVPISPRCLYGLRQSTLIQLATSRRLILGRGHRYLQLPVNDVDSVCYGSRRSGSERERGNGRVGCMVWEKSESFDLGIGGTAEAMLSLLTEEVDERFFGVGKRNGRLGVRRVRAEEGRRNVGEYCREEEKCVECDCSKRKLNRNVKSINISARDEDKYVELDLMKRGSKGKFESYSAKSSEEERKWSGGRNGLSWGDNSGLRKWNRNVESINIRSREEDKYVESESLKRDSREKLQPVNPKLREEHMWSGGREGFSKSENSGLRKSNRNMESVSIRSKKENKYVESDLLERDSRGKLESFSAKSRDEERKWSGGREGLSRGENSGLRKEVSNCSSYYSALSADDIDESDVDVQIKHERFMDGSWNKNKESRREDGEYRENVRKQSKIYGGDVKEKHEQVTVRSNTERESSVVATGLDWHSRNETKKKFTDQAVRQLESRKQSFQNLSNVQEIHQSASETPPSKEQLGGREGHSMESIDETRKHFRETELQVYEHAGSKRKSQKLTEISGIRDIEIEGPSSSFVQFRGRDENPTESAYLTKEASEKYNPTIHSSSGQTESSMKSEQLTRIMTRESDIQRTSTSQRLSEVTLTNRDDSSTLLAEANGKQVRPDQQVIVRSQSKKEPQDTNIPMSRVSNTTTVIDAQKHFESRKSIREKRSNSTMDLVEEALEEKRLATGRVLLKGRTSEESQRPNRLSSFRESSSATSSSSQAPFSLVQQAAMQQLNEGNESRGSEVIMTPPRPQLVKRTVRESVHYQEPTSRLATEEVSRETSSYESTNLSTEEVTDDFYLEADHNTRKNKLDREHSELMFQDDALGSANRLEESSTQFVGDFAEKLRHEGSVLLEETTSSQTTLGFKGEGYTHQDSRQQVSDDFQSQVHGSNRSSFGTGRRAPPDEMWDVAGPSSLEPPRTEATGVVTPSTGSAVVKSSRSLWGIIADIVRLRWGMQSETHKSTVKLGVKSSSNESMGSEVWFSGHETDDKDDENFNKGKRVVPKVDVSSDRRYLEKSSNEREQEASGVASGYKVLQTEADKPSSSGAVESSSQRREENFGRKDLRRGQSVPSSISTVNSSLPLTSRQFIRSPPLIEQIPETSKPETSGSGLEEIVEPVREHPSVASEMDVKDGELKQRKLQRNKQVLQERFGEWEEAYRLESEQRIIDEMFMREALLEAKRAADTWEVPVGAVLVKQGKIIARGCNLVEELRDSTAHAEMICIREASNVLRTWRLADTTLYVTLEPCAMCAGAILQARVDTVVWGAPNKLLGADGSWVRLFPSGGEGGGHDLSNQAAGPVHPFHPKMTIRRGILSAECADAMQQFFQLRRKKEKKPSSPPASCLPISTHPSKFISKMHDIFSIMFCG